MELKWKPNCCCGGWCSWWWYGLAAAAAKSRGRPLPRFMAAPTAAAGVYCPAATAADIGADAEIGVAFNGWIRLPSGPYFLGLPRFFPTLTNGPADRAPLPAAATIAVIIPGGTNRPLELTISTGDGAGACEAVGGGTDAGDWKLTVASGTTAAAAAATGAAAAAVAVGELASPGLASMRAALDTEPAPTRASDTSSRH